MRSRFQSILRKVTGFELRRPHPLEEISRKVYLKYRDFTMVPEGLYKGNLTLAYDHRNVQGCVVECGVWRGGMIAGMAEILPDRMFYLFDSFEGLPDVREIDGPKAVAWQKNKEGETYYDNCKAQVNFAEQAMTRSGARHSIVKGWFDDKLPATVLESPIAILRLDGDWYDSTMSCMKTLYPQVASGGIVIIDDYYTWDGCSRAIHDYLSSVESPSRIHKTIEGVPYLIKKE